MRERNNTSQKSTGKVKLTSAEGCTTKSKHIQQGVPWDFISDAMLLFP
jgi:hypothetical protein